MTDNNFKCPKTGKEFFIQNYRILGNNRYSDSRGRPLCSSEGVELEFIERDRGFPVAVFGTTNERAAKNQQFFKKVADKHANSLDMKIQKRERTKEELKRYTNK